jgi:hypothetical protein
VSHAEKTRIVAEWSQSLSWTTLSESGLGASSHFPVFLIVSLIETYRKSREMVIRDLGRRSSWENHGSLMILHGLEFFELFDGQQDRNDFNKPDCRGPAVGTVIK